MYNHLIPPWLMDEDFWGDYKANDEEEINYWEDDTAYKPENEGR